MCSRLPRTYPPVLFSLALIAVVLLASCGGSGHATPESALTQTQQSDHFVYHFTPGDRVDPARTEAFYSWITAQLSIDPGRTINYYKYTDVGQKRRLTGRIGNAYADTSNFAVHTIWPADNHEVTHLVTSTVGTPTALFNEGFAVAFETNPYDGSYTAEWNGQLPHLWAKQFLQQGRLPQLSGIVDNTAFFALDSNVTYPTAGSFVIFLVSQHGLAKVLQMFPGANYTDPPSVTEARFQQAFGVSITQAEQDWLAFLAQF